MDLSLDAIGKRHDQEKEKSELTEEELEITAIAERAYLADPTSFKRLHDFFREKAAEDPKLKKWIKETWKSWFGGFLGKIAKWTVLINAPFLATFGEPLGSIMINVWKKLTNNGSREEFISCLLEIDTEWIELCMHLSP